MTENLKEKICPYCKEKVYYTEEVIEYYIKENIRGITCDLCGKFIEIHRDIIKEIIENNNYDDSWRLYKEEKRKNRNSTIIVMIILIIIIFPVSIYSYISYYNSSFSDVPHTLTQSTFTIICNTTGNDMSEEIKMSVWEPKEGMEFENENDLYNLSKYQLLIDPKLPVNISIDLRHLSYYLLVEINPNTLHINYTNDYYIINYGINFNYVFWAYYIGDL